MKGFIAYFVKYPVAANLLMFGILILGVISLGQMKATFFPESPSRIINVQLIYPGASPEEVEEGIINKIEEGLKGLTGVERYTSVSSENSGRITVEVLKGYDTDLILQDVKNEVDRISSFPVGMEPPVIYKQEQLGRAITFALSGDNVSLEALKAAARQVEDDLLAIEGLSKVELSGFPDEEIEIAFREADLQTYQLTFQEAADAVRRTNVDITGGTVKGTEEELLLRARNKEYYADGLRDIIVKTTPAGGVVRLSQVATVRDRWSDQPNRAYLDGSPSVSVSVQNTLDEDMLYITDRVKEYLEVFNAENANIRASVISDASITLRQRIDTLIQNGWQGFLIVCVLLAVFLHWRLAFWVALSIPISFAGMFIIANFLGITLNVISLFGMILVIGILVDDGIVIGENIFSYHEKGVPRVKAAIDGTNNVLSAVFAAVLTTIIAFSSFFFLDGSLGDFFLEMAIVVIFSLAFSLVEGAVILPTHVAHSKALAAGAEPNWIQRRFDALMNLMRDRMYVPVLDWTVRHKFVTLACCLALLFLSFGLVQGGFVKTTFFPIIEGDDVAITLQLPAGTPESKTKEVLDRIVLAAEKVNRRMSDETYNGEKELVERIQTTVGPTAYQGSINVALIPGEEREPITQREVTNAIRAAVGPVDEAEVLSFGGGSFFGKPVSVSLVGSNIDELEAATADLKAELEQMTELTDVVDNNQEGLREMNISLKEKARYLGLDLQDIVGQVRSAFFGTEAQRLQRGEDEVRVWLRYGEDSRRSIYDLQNMRIRLPDGSEYPLSEIADLEPQRGVIAINHVNGKREVKIDADVSDNSVSVTDVNGKVQGVILPAVLDRYPGVSTVTDGQVRNQQKTAASAAIVVPVVLALMFFVVALTFRSVLQALILFLLIPFGFIGVIWGHWLMDKPISLFSALGVIALVGVIVNDGLVFIATYNDNIRNGMTMMDALRDAGYSRFRPILLTTVTTFAGLAPLLLNKSRQAQFLIPMAISVAFGLLATTLILLVLLPALVVLLNRFRYYLARLTNSSIEEYREVEPAYKQLNFENENYGSPARETPQEIEL
ncbi:efflux RND transporter permease subunit [Neolewinella lacunae]|uniref:Efflux RND transporter permease subunit n=1 Tax=Neolewinella lacunae TaxID=1517758 RepID=A0A923PJT6_9BACT|nr:efflux RND transporter permease subunit [Neolewinella lacunae]MBC6995387.1 efflux RND transporter permease subunit [Neolewinella lacunae]MDN3633099.1 efflux RND transporter permease subunit [Neolewinella lacunae]